MLEISLIEVLPGIIHACELAKITPHTTVLITGQGVSGLVMTQVCLILCCLQYFPVLPCSVHVARCY